jgi:cobalamin synthase
MEAGVMRDLLLQCSGLAAIAVALIHGVLGETGVLARATIEPARLRTLIRLVWQAGTVAWIGGGVLLLAAPSMASEPARHWIVATLACVFAFAALANAWATRGRHFGWMALSVVVVLAVAGY